MFVAPQNTKGGIGSVLQLYSSYLENIDVLYTYPENKSVSRYLFFLKSLIDLFYKLSTNRNIGIIHIHTASRGSFYRKTFVLLIAKLFGKKVILHIHGGGFKRFVEGSLGHGSWIVSIMHLADLNICLSIEWLEYFKKKWGVKNIVVLPNPIVMPSYNFEKKPNKQIALLYLGAVVQSKGIFDLVEFLSNYQNCLDGKILLHIGGEGDLDRLRQFVDKHKMANQIVIHGWVKAEQKVKLFQNSDLFILPSYTEGLPMSILEAMSYGKPIVATNVGGIPSLVKTEVNGWLFDPSDFKQLNVIFNELFDQPQLLLDYGKRSYDLAWSYDIHTIAQRLEQLYEQI